MENHDPMLARATALISETMGAQIGEDFHRLYEFDDAKGIVEGARLVLLEFMGPKMSEEKLKKLKGSE